MNWPTSTEYVVALPPTHCSLPQLAYAVRAAARDKGKAPANSQQHLPTPDSFHVHTTTIQASISRPDQTIDYYNRAPEPNPAYGIYQDICRTLVQISDASEPVTIAAPSNLVLRRPWVAEPRKSYNGRAAAGPAPVGVRVHLPHTARSETFLKIDSLPHSSPQEWMPSATGWDMKHWIHAAIALDPHKDHQPSRKGAYRGETQKIHLRSSAKVCWFPGEDSGATPDIQIIITIQAYLDMAVIAAPLPDTAKDMMGLILHSVIPSRTSTAPTTELEDRAAGLRDFYACLRPAPEFPHWLEASALQPKEMVSKLLPFQTRTVKMLMEREGAGRVEEDAGMKHDPKGFWQELQWDDEGRLFAYRRATGDIILVSANRDKGKERGHGNGRAPLSPELPCLIDLSHVNGSMLCEEMGLGKTVETIALVALHRHPLSTPRLDITPSIWPAANDSVSTIDLSKGVPGLDDPVARNWVEAEKAAFAGRKAWDAQAQLNVSEVAATLIVTPPSLLKQWVAEIRRHAPTLRVCVYDGWQSLQRGVEKQRDAQKRIRAKKETERKRKAQEQSRNNTRNKYAKTSNGQAVKSEHHEEKAEVDDQEEEDGTPETILDITQSQFLEHVRSHDIVITTYQDLSSDLKVALPAPARSRRSKANYRLSDRPRSPLVMVEWWRVIMDEVQLQGDSDSAAMVSVIPRKLSLAVSGTPARGDIKDLMGSLKFLRVPVFPYDNRLWHRILQPSFRPAFEGLFQSLAIRTTKKEVSGEFDLPHQSRFIVPIELSEIEMHYYTDTLERARERLHLPADPSEARPQDWVLDRAVFLQVFRTLRQICTHIQVGQMQAGGGQASRGDQRRRLGRTLMTMKEALEKMREDHEQETLVEARQQMRMIIRQAQLIILDEQNDLRHLQALALYDRVRHSIDRYMESVQQELNKLLGGRGEGEVSDNEYDVGDLSDRLSQQEKAKRTAIMITHIVLYSLRELAIIKHQALFFSGDAYHVQHEEEKEVSAYAQADAIRKDVLKIPLAAANMALQSLRRTVTRSPAVKTLDDLQISDVKRKGGIQTYDVFAQANELLKIMNDNALLVFNWRDKIYELLISPVEGEKPEAREGAGAQDIEDPEEEYYAEALKAQGEGKFNISCDLEAYLIAYAAALADRKEFMFESRSLLASHDARVTKQASSIASKLTNAAMNALDSVEIPAVVDDDIEAQASILMAEREAFRNARLERGCDRPLKALLMELNGEQNVGLLQRVIDQCAAVIHGPHRQEEIDIAKAMAAVLKHYLTRQGDNLEKLDKELDLFRQAFNRRVKYFASLQELSDSVAVPDFKDLGRDIEAAAQEVNELEVKLAKMAVKGRYLQYLGTKEHDENDLKEDCIICFGSSDCQEAVLLTCGHYFCQSCFKEYRATPGGRKCPSCRVAINDKEIQRIKLNHGRPESAEGLGETPALTSTESQPQKGPENPDIFPEEAERLSRIADLEKLRMLEDDRRRAIMLMDMMGEYGSKINFLVKHLLYYKSKEPRSRHVIFSNWSDSLNIVMAALKINGISFLGFDHGRKQKDIVERFLNDESITVFLLHAERESSGLTLTSCRVVHLLEPVLRHSYELQAIGRVDRLGQDKETSVFCYATMDTVESRILSQGVRNGTSIYLASDDADDVVAEMPNVASAAHKGGDVTAGGSEEEMLGLIL
ncbi:hypothetical protein I350_05986 [Cryptococcus amylolentus CBS 6273]|uniref:RING-type domain-containing protein n=1 Tax=Cryptococcus amylolentus CBS 6273 TaxID=1296118 RepID=A0A1E3JQJ1_9TREE|nr:hypothetical protein I350_05986 [Cryptococcus amylolentus CBS 6273]